MTRSVAAPPTRSSGRCSCARRGRPDRQTLAGVAKEIAWSVPVGLFAVVNPSPTPRADLAEVEVAVPDDWPAVDLELPDGRRVPTQERSRKHPFVFEIEMLGREIVGWIRRRLYGREVYQHQWNGWRSPVRGPADDRPRGRRRAASGVAGHGCPARRDRDRRHGRRRCPLARPGPRLGLRRSAWSALTPDIPRLGWTTVTPVEATDNCVTTALARSSPGRTDGRWTTAPLRIVVETDGTLTLTGGGAELPAVGRMVDGGDAGDSYNYAPPAEDTSVSRSRGDVGLRGRGDPVGRIAIERRYRWPVGLAGDR